LKFYENYNRKLEKELNNNKKSNLEIYGKLPFIKNAGLKVLENNIYGVDLDNKAAEITALSLMLHVMDELKSKNLKFPSILGQNIKVGNSLISGIANREELIKYQDDLKKLIDLRNALKSAYDELDKIKIMADICNISEGTEYAIDYLNYHKHFIENNKYDLNKDRKIAVLDKKLKEIAKESRVGINKKLNEKLNKWFKNPEDVKPFNWEVEFPEVFANGGFDVVVGNPPYIDGRNIEEVELKYYKTLFIAGDGKVNTFCLFIERGLNLSNLNGYISYIVPPTLLRNTRYRAIRGEILKRSKIHKLICLNSMPFEDAVVEGLIINLQQENNEESRDSWRVISLVLDTIDDLENAKLHQLSQSFYKTTPYNRFYVFLDSYEVEILKKMKIKSIELSNLCETKDGISTGFKPFPEKLLGYKQGEYFVALDGSKEKFDSDLHKKIIDGGEFHRYTPILWENRYIKYDKSIEQNPKPARGRAFNCQLREKYIFIQPEKIITRQTADSLIGTYDDNQFFTRNSIHNTYFYPNIPNYSLKYILGILNSKILTYYHRKMTEEIGSVHPQVHIEDIRKLPIYPATIDQQKPIIILVDKIMELKKKRHAINTDLAHYITPNKIKETTLKDYLCKIGKENYWRITEPEDPMQVYHDIAELRVHKDKEFIIMDARVKIRNKKDPREFERDENNKIITEWMAVLKAKFPEEVEKLLIYYISNIKKFKGGYRNNLWNKLLDAKIPALTEEIKNAIMEYEKNLEIARELDKEIEKVDKSIDRLVYELYGLTEEDIKVVEESLGSSYESLPSKEEVEELLNSL